MLGNVWEWCQDWYDSGTRVLRGGSWGGSDGLRVAVRVNVSLTLTGGNYGFRCVSGFPAAQQ